MLTARKCDSEQAQLRGDDVEATLCGDLCATRSHGTGPDDRDGGPMSGNSHVTHVRRV
jgi:hypothetical protein